MQDLAENNLIRFKNISRKKEAIYANFKVKGVKGGVNFTASITVDPVPVNEASTPALVSEPAQGTLTLNVDGLLSYIHNGNYSGVDTLSHTTSDGSDKLTGSWRRLVLFRGQGQGDRSEDFRDRHINKEVHR